MKYITYCCAAAVLIGAGLAASAAAQTCASPVKIMAEVPTSGDTCLSSNSLPNIGSLLTPHPDVVHTFQGGPGVEGTLAILADFNGLAILIAAPCGTTGEPLDAVPLVPSVSVNLPVPALPPGPYFVVVTGDDSSFVPPYCGNYQITPIGFVLDRVFRSGFE